MKTNAKIVIGTLVLGLSAAAASLAVRPPANWDSTSFEFHFPLAANILMAILHLGAALLFILSLSTYKAKLRLAFLSIVIGILLIGFGTVQLPIIDVFNLWATPYVTYGVIALPFVVSGLALYFGAASFGRLVGEKSIVTTRSLIILLAILASLGSSVLPHVQTPTPELNYDITAALYIWIFVLDLSAAIVFFRVRRRIGSHYKKAMLWLGLAMLSSVTCISIALLDIFLASGVRSVYMHALNVMVVVAGLAWLKAGYTFTRTKEY